MTQTNLRQTVNKSISCPLAKETAERYIGHIGELRYFGQRDCFIEILVHEIKGLFDSSAVVSKLVVGKCRVRQYAQIPGNRQIVQYGNEFEYGIESMFLILCDYVTLVYACGEPVPYRKENQPLGRSCIG